MLQRITSPLLSRPWKPTNHQSTLIFPNLTRPPRRNNKGSLCCRIVQEKCLRDQDKRTKRQ
jgi:hypothetical protein